MFVLQGLSLCSHDYPDWAGTQAIVTLYPRAAAAVSSPSAVTGDDG